MKHRGAFSRSLREIEDKMGISDENLEMFKLMGVSQQWRVGIVTSRFNRNITSLLEAGAMARLYELGFQAQQCRQINVPGAVEIPLASQWLLESGCDGVITLGAVIRGETTHYESVCTSVERGCSELNLKFNKPVVFGVLTTENEEQALDRCGGHKGHKGAEAAEVLLEMLSLQKKLRSY